MSDTIPMDLAERVLDRLGLGERPEPSLAGLGRLYKAWCKQVPFDNVQKRLYFHAGGDGALPGTTPTNFFESYLRHGTGGTCWSTSGALHALGKTLGFAVCRAAGSMLGTPDENFPNHGTLIATIEGESYLVDTSMLSEEVLVLRRGSGTATGDPVYGIRAEPMPMGDRWKIWWKPGHSRDEIECHLEHLEVDHDFYRTRYESTRQVSLFNTSLYTRRNLGDGGIIAIGRGHFIVIDGQNRVSATPVDRDRDQLLIERFGFSEEIVSRLPEDSAGKALG